MRNFKIFMVSLLALFIVSDCFAQPAAESSENREVLDQFINSPDDALKILAMQMIITDPTQVKSQAVAYDLYDIFRTHSNVRVRQLALNAIYKLNYVWVLKNLKDDYYRETNPLIRRQISAILQEFPILMAIR